jgi:hypothetical protein
MCEGFCYSGGFIPLPGSPAQGEYNGTDHPRKAKNKLRILSEDPFKRRTIYILLVFTKKHQPINKESMACAHKSFAEVWSFPSSFILCGFVERMLGIIIPDGPQGIPRCGSIWKLLRKININRLDRQMIIFTSRLAPPEEYDRILRQNHHLKDA